MDRLEVFAGCAIMGVLSLAYYLVYRRAGERSVHRRTARNLIRFRFRNTPSVLLAGACFWFVCALAVPVLYLPDPWPKPVGWLVLGLFVASIVVLVWWSVRPPRWTMPEWHRQLLEAHPRPVLTRGARVANRCLFAGWLLLVVGAWATFRLGGSALLWVPLAAGAFVCLIVYVFRNE